MWWWAHEPQALGSNEPGNLNGVRRRVRKCFPGAAADQKSCSLLGNKVSVPKFYLNPTLDYIDLWEAYKQALSPGEGQLSCIYGPAVLSVLGGYKSLEQTPVVGILFSDMYFLSFAFFTSNNNKGKNILCSNFPFIQPFYMPFGFCLQSCQYCHPPLADEKSGSQKSTRIDPVCLSVTKLMNGTWGQEAGLLARSAGDLSAPDSNTLKKKTKEIWQAKIR